MSDIARFEAVLHSPRCGLDRTCSLRLEREKATFGLDAKTATCSWPEGSDPIWSGYAPGRGNPVEEILENDKIYPPTIFVRALEYAWEAWRDGRLDVEAAQREMGELCKWVNDMTDNRPRTNFWRMTF